MCIDLGQFLSASKSYLSNDLVGITYITKIHYFGRKFRGTDILQLLKRKRALERQLAMGNTDEFLHMVQQIAQEQQK